MPDLQETYGVDLRDIFVPGSGLTPMYVFSLIRGLPIGSRFYAERRGGQEFRGWDESRYAAVAVVNAVRALQYTYILAHSKSKPKMPEAYPTPDQNRSRAGKPGSFANTAFKALSAARKRKAGL